MKLIATGLVSVLAAQSVLCARADAIEKVRLNSLPLHHKLDLASRSSFTHKSLLQDDEDFCDKTLPGISQQCSADNTAWCRDDEFFDQFTEFQGINQEGCAFDIPEEFNENTTTFEVAPCDAGVEEFTPICAEQGGWMCQISIDESVRLTAVSPPEEFRFIVTQHSCLPRSCSSNDFDIAFDSIEDAYREVAGELLRGSGLEVDLSFSVFCDDNGVPANFGSGTQTEVSIAGDVTDEATFTLACEECEPAWEVEVVIGADFDAGQFANTVAASLNGNEAFGSAGCKAVWLQDRDTFNVYCRDNEEVTISVDLPAPAGALSASRLMKALDSDTGVRLAQSSGAEPLTNFEGNGLTLSGRRRSFETSVVDGNSASRGGSPLGALSIGAVSVISIVLASFQ